MDFSHMLCVAVTLLVSVIETESCMCSPRSLRDYYCNSAFAVKARVSNWTADSDSPLAESHYTLHVIKSFKLPANLRNETELFVHSMASDGLCGINPGRHNLLGRRRKLNTSYFITGFMTEDGSLWSMLCRNTYRTWRWLTKQEKRTIRYAENLTC